MASSAIAMPTSAKVEATLMAAFNPRRRSPRRSIAAPARSGSTTGAIIR